MKATKEIIIIASLLSLPRGTAFAETASELHRSPQYQDHERALALLDAVPSEIRSCVWQATQWGQTLTEFAARTRIAQCQRIREDQLRRQAEREREQDVREWGQAMRRWLSIFTPFIFLVLVIIFYKGITAGLCNLFVGILAFGIRVKRFLDHAMKEAAGRNQ